MTKFIYFEDTYIAKTHIMFIKLVNIEEPYIKIRTTDGLMFLEYYESLEIAEKHLSGILSQINN